jgi:hypothetical protein
MGFLTELYRAVWALVVPNHKWADSGKPAKSSASYISRLIPSGAKVHRQFLRIGGARLESQCPTTK